jgi:hypothetical protein
MTVFLKMQAEFFILANFGERIGFFVSCPQGYYNLSVILTLTEQERPPGLAGVLHIPCRCERSEAIQLRWVASAVNS